MTIGTVYLIFYFNSFKVAFLEFMCMVNKTNANGKSEGSQPEQGSDECRETSPKPFSQLCPFCKKVLTTRSNLQRHIATHHKRQHFSCPTCNKKFTRKVGFALVIGVLIENYNNKINK